MVSSYEATGVLGHEMVVHARVVSARPVSSIEVDHVGDGHPGEITAGLDLRAVRALAFVPRRVGEFELVVRATDVLGCVGATGIRRPVSVRMQ